MESQARTNYGHVPALPADAPRLKRPAIILALCLVAGMFAGTAIPVAPFQALAAAGLVLAAHFLLRSRFSALLGGGQALWAVVLLVGVAQQRALIREEDVARRGIEQAASGATLSFSGRIASPVIWRQGDGVVDVGDVRLRRPGRPGALEAPLRIRLLCREGAAAALRESGAGQGDAIHVGDAVLGRKALANPGVFDYDEVLLQRSVIATATCRHAGQIDTPAAGRSRRWTHQALRAVAAWREAIIVRLRAHMPPSSADLAEAVFLGHGWTLSPGRRESYFRSGLMHVFSVSGLHTGIIVLFIFLALRLARLPPRLAYVVSCVLLAVYAALVEFNPPVLRAAIMYACVFAPFFLRYKVESLSALAVAAIATLLFSPRSLWQAGFQMSYLCMFGIITLSPVMSEMVFGPDVDDDDRPAPASGIGRLKWRVAWVGKFVVGPGLIGGVVRGSRQWWISEWPSAKDNPPPPAW